MPNAYPQMVAERVLDDLGIHDPDDLQNLAEIAWMKNALVIDRHMVGAEARLVVGPKRSIITVSSFEPHRRRFSIAHELGHLEMHRQQSGLNACTDSDMNTWGLSHSRVEGITVEQQANDFAAAFLLPERFISHSCKSDAPSLELISGLADRFNVSMTATALRFLAFCGEPCAVVFSQYGRVKWFRRNREFEELGLFVETRCQIDKSTSASAFFAGRTMSTNATPVLASAWLAPGPYHPDAKISEHSICMPTYNAVLTLLWIDEVIDGEDEDFRD